MKLNKALMLAIIAAAFVSFSDTLTRGGFQSNPRPQEVQRIDEQTLKVKTQDQWITYKKTVKSCAPRPIPSVHSGSRSSRNARSKPRPQYEFSDNTRVILNVVESNGWCRQYQQERELTPDEKGIILEEEVLRD